jgi:hypothetical protein
VLLAAVLVATLVAGGVAARRTLRATPEAGSGLVVLGDPGDRAEWLSFGRLDAEPTELTDFAGGASLLPWRLIDATPESEGANEQDVAAIPHDGGAMVAWYRDDRTTVAVVRPDEAAPEPLLEVDGSASLFWDPETQRYAAVGDADACFSGTVGRPAGRIGRQGRCSVHPSGRILVLDELDDGATTPTYDAAVLELSGTEVAEFQAEGSVEFSPAGGRIAVSTDGQVILVDPADGSLVGRADGRELVRLGWATTAEVLLLASSGDDGAVLSVLGEDGQTEEVLRGPEVTGQISPDGATVIGATQEGRRVTIARIDVASGTTETLLEGDDLRFVVLGTGTRPQLIVWSPRNGATWRGEIDRGDLTKVGKIGTGQPSDPVDDFEATQAPALFLDEDTGTMYSTVPDGNGTEVSLIAVDEAGVRRVAGPWQSVRVEQLNDGTLLAVAWDGENEVLVMVQGDEVSELDTAERVEAPYFDGERVVYTWTEQLTAPDAAEVRMVEVDGDRRPVTLQQGRRVVGRTVPRPTVTQGGANPQIWLAANPQCRIDPDIRYADRQELYGTEPARLCLAVGPPRGRVIITASLPPSVTMTVTDQAGEVIDTLVGAGESVVFERVLDVGLYRVELVASDPDGFLIVDLLADIGD